MATMKPAPALVAATAIVLFACVLQTAAKTRNFADSGGADASASPAEIEKRLRPALEERVKIRRGAKSGGGQSARRPATAPKPRRPAINQQDLYLLTRAWNSMTPEFRALYAEATDFPSGYGGYDSYVSPGGNFKIFYTTSGPDSISGVDTIGYGDAGESSASMPMPKSTSKKSTSTWRTRNHGSNNVPDYIDEAAFALDSAWSMLIGRFGFVKPIPSREPGGPSTGPYNVLITNMEDYGVTIPHSGSFNPGFASHVEINGDWSGDDWVDLGYDKRPYDALRVTCAHEFFHAIQYAMVWTMGLDDITYGWLEGSAVLMEEIAFPDINDYLQYIRQFFTNPRVSLLSNNYSYLYMNGLVLKYLYEKASPSGESIAMIKAVHDNARAQRMISFHRNITQAANAGAGRPWAEVLNGFHAESYFTGARARPWAFVSDAERMNSWRVPATAATAEEGLTIGAYAVGFLRYEPQPDHPDTLVLTINGDRDRSVGGIIWGASALVTEDGDSVGIAPIPIDQNGYGRFKLAGWKSKSRCLLILTNAGP
ncbi:MAG: hypothetical protein LBH93_08245, partial [Chitinispirillales bacterium]|nr:hypothetical protein [Chitinispirillales bacterium]